MTRHLAARALGLLLAGLLLGSIPAPSAQAAGNAVVTVVNDRGGRFADLTHRTPLTVSGRGFQAVRGGFGGVYVAFGWVRDPAAGAWRPSRGGVTGRDYRYVPDAEDAANQGYLRFVSFPGGSTEAEANAVMDHAGRFRVDLAVPGPVFESVDRDGEVVEVDCREVTCGVITIGAHGVVNARNETFTPVSFTDVHSDSPAAPAPAAGATPSSSGGSGAAGSTQPTSRDAGGAGGSSTGSAPGPTTGSGSGTGGSGGSGAATETGTTGSAARPASGSPTLVVDRATAVAGRTLAFTGTGFAPGEQVLAILDDGAAAHGPMVAGSGGDVAGVLRLPLETAVGTHALRLSAAASGAQVAENFPVRADVAPAATSASAGTTRTAAVAASSNALPRAYLALSVAVLVLALVVAARRVRARRRVASPGGVGDAGPGGHPSGFSA